MLELFAVYGMLCIFDPNAESGQKCMNFWEEPIVHYTKNQCMSRSKEIGQNIEENFKKEGLLFHELSIWCVPTKQQKL